MNEPRDSGRTADIPSAAADSLDAGLAAGFGRPPDGPGSVLSSLRHSLGDFRPVLLREAEGDSGHVVKPKSDAMPTPEQSGCRYQLSGEIARGGMGAILRGRDVDLGRDLAFKVLLEKHANRPEVARRFIEEAQIGGQLQHPGVVPVYDLGRFGDRPFFSMKLVKGQTLSALLRERANPTRDRPRFLAIGLQVAQTMAYAHAKGVIHRDLKPANIMVGAFGEVQVMDWGLAKVLAEGGVVDEEKASQTHEREDATRIRTARSTGTAGIFGTQTEAGSLLGTPAYMPPEQANGDIITLDRRADVFGLGAILCDILTGKPPYGGRSSEEVRRKAANGDLADAIARLDACGADLELIVLTKACLAPEAIDRPKDAQAVADGLRIYLDSVQDRLHQAELAEAEAKAKAVEEAKRRRLTLALAGIVLLSATLGGGGFLWIKQEHDVRQAQVSRNVNGAMNRATALREQAKAALVGGAVLFAQAREQVQRALALVENGPADLGLQEQVRRLQVELDEEEHDRQLVAALDAARLAQAETVSGENRFATERAVPMFREAFRLYGLVAGEVEPVAAAERIRQRPAAVREAIIIALDEWDALVDNAALAINEPHRAWLQAVVQAAEPDESLTQKFRAARKEEDEAKRRTALEKLASADDVAKMPVRGLLRLASRLERVQSESRAEELMRLAQERDPGDFWANHLLGSLFGRMTPPKLDEAVRFLTVAVALRPESPGTYLNLGYALHAKGAFDEAIACYHKAIELDPRYATAHNNLGFALKAKGQVDQAIACYRQAIQFGPKDATPHNNLGIALMDRGEVEQAIACYRHAIELNSKYAPAHNNLGNALLAKGQVDEAIACCRHAVLLDAKNTTFHYNLGKALERKGQMGEAKASYRQAIALDPRYAFAHNQLGNLLARNGQVEEAIVSFRQAIEHNPKLSVAHYNLGKALHNKGQLDEAITLYRKAVELNPNDAQAHGILALGWLGKGRYAEARDAATRALELLPENHPLRTVVTQLLQRAKLEEENANSRKAITSDPNDAEAHHDLGVRLWRNGQIDEAISSFRRAIALDPKLVQAHRAIGSVFAAQGRLDEAIASYQKALEIDPQQANIQTFLGGVLDSKGKVDEAIACHLKAIALDPKLATAHYSLGVALGHKGEVDKAIASYRQAIALDPRNARAHNNLGLLLVNKRQIDEAIASYNRAIQVDRKFAAAHYNLGTALIGMGQIEEAVTSFRQGIALDPKLARNGVIVATMFRSKQLYARAAGLFSAVFAEDPKLANNLKANYRYTAACCAALVGAGKGLDAGRVGDKERARLRRQALDWLRADLDLWRQKHQKEPLAAMAIQEHLKRWLTDADFAVVRGTKELMQLPKEEQAAWLQFWSDVEALRRSAAMSPNE
jgi:serine/threonine-protein kinase